MQIQANTNQYKPIQAGWAPACRWCPSVTLGLFRSQWQASSWRASLKAHVTELMRQDLGANSPTSIRGPWSGHPIILYGLSDVWKIKHAVAVMTADTIRINSHLHILRDNRFQETIFMFIINTHKYIKYIHSTYTIHS